MEQIESKLPDWIRSQAALGEHVDLDDGIEYAPNERFWYLLTLFCPLIFESYAIMLHPFWVKTEQQDLLSNLPPKKDEGYRATSWSDFFELYNRHFDLKSALDVQEAIRLELVNNNQWPKHISFPAEGDMGNTQIQQIRDVILNLYGDIDVNYYYCVLKTTDWFNDEIMLKGKLSELEELWLRSDLRDNPSAIYPALQKWCIVTDYDSQMTYIGGSQELINRLTALKGCDIHQLTPKLI